MATLVHSQNNYKSCPLKKRPIVFVAEESERPQSAALELTKPTMSHLHTEEAPQDLSLKRKASQDFEDYSVPAKREFVLNLSVNSRAHNDRSDAESASEETLCRAESSPMLPNDHLAAMLTPNAEYESKLEYQAAAAIHLRGLTAATAGYTTNPYQSAFVLAAGCNPMSALWNVHPGVSSSHISSIFPSPASSVTSSASPRSVYSSGCISTQIMTPPSSPGSEASESSEPEDLSVRNDIPLPALFHFFDEAPTSAVPAGFNSSSTHYGGSHSSSSSLGSNNAAKNYRFKCDKCSKMYSTSIGLSKHQQFHCPAAECNQEKKQHACEECGKLYTTVGALKMHIRTHTLPCKCPICGKAFSRPWLLQGHIRTHTGEKPFQCPDCPRSFADRSNLRAHQQTHFEVKKYACKVCGKSFSRMSLLNKHASSSCSITIV